MSSTVDSIVTLSLIYGFPMIAVIIRYKKMNAKEKREVRESFGTLEFLCTGGFLIIGAFLLSVGNVFEFFIAKVMGLVFIVPGAILMTIRVWKRSKMRSIIFFLFFSVMIFLGTWF
ncbi:hypothetical protein [Pseudalkalibacillus sp. NRS-1564]|uniref:hypothetical protein n=1 Tax=Pseudalkalibacillus sp. NRS-1564 TaxID=3233900 RepID=UPI003D2A34D3